MTHTPRKCSNFSQLLAIFSPKNPSSTPPTHPGKRKAATNDKTKPQNPPTLPEINTKKCSKPENCQAKPYQDPIEIVQPLQRMSASQIQQKSRNLQYLKNPSLRPFSEIELYPTHTLLRRCVRAPALPFRREIRDNKCRPRRQGAHPAMWYFCKHAT